MALAKTQQRSPARKIARCIIGACVAIIAAFAIYSIAVYAYTIGSTRDDVYTISQVEGEGIEADAIVVLGASVYADGTPSDILADRLEVASDLYLAGASSQLIVSGDNTTAHYNESDAMKAYCVELGVPADAITVDHEGYDTYASIYRAHFVYGAQSIIVVTQAYHLYRALMIAEGLGMRAWGVAADKGDYNNQTMYSLREIFARDKDFLLTMIKASPAEVG